MTAPETTARTYHLQIPPEAAAERLDRYLGSLKELNLSRTRIQKLIGDGLVAVNGRRVSKRHLLAGGEAVTVTVPPPSA
ncbi:MAG: S4 domain-containing protein, partial [candidate division Zixibacteria bacterium]|nr:S4 domain-containing protein [candidate division Zixibacteria bacterium]